MKLTLEQLNMLQEKRSQHKELTTALDTLKRFRDIRTSREPRNAELHNHFEYTILDIRNRILEIEHDVLEIVFSDDVSLLINRRNNEIADEDLPFKD